MELEPANPKFSEFPKVFDFSDPVDFLHASLKSFQKTNSKFSLRSWSRQLGMTQPAMLSMVLSRKRKLMPQLSSKVSEYLLKRGKLTESEARYLDILVLFSNARTLEEKAFYQKILASLRPDQSFSTLQLDQIRIVSDWVHSALLEMTELKNFKATPEWIAARLGNRISPSQIGEAIERLLRVGLLERTSQGKLKKTQAKLATPTDIPNKSLRQFHAEMLQKAILALETQSIEQRDITGHVMALSIKKLPEAKILIRNFRRQLAELVKADEGTSKESVYFLGVQLFDLLESGRST